MYFEGYTFDTSFTLRFVKSSLDKKTNRWVPLITELYLLGEWWFHTEDEWKCRLGKLNKHGFSASEESLQAFDLANLRWRENSRIDSVLLTDEMFKMKLKNGCQLTISCVPVEGESWVLIGKEYKIDGKELWSIVCEGGEYFINDG